MKENRQIISRKDVFIVAGMLMSLMVEGSIWDYSISLILYNESNLFGIILARYGDMPVTLGVLMSGVLFIKARNTHRRRISAFQVIAGVVLCILGSAMALLLPGVRFNNSTLIIYAVSIAISLAAIMLVLRLANDAERTLLIQVAIVIITVIIFVNIIINTVKILWGRSRMVLIANNSEAHVTPWWVIGGEKKLRFMVWDIPAEMFKSFPSGHTANSAILMLLCLLPVLKKSLKLFYTGVFWGERCYACWWARIFPQIRLLDLL